MDISLNNEKKRQFTFYIDLLAATINKTDVEQPDNINWELLVRHAQRNCVLNILGYGVEKLKDKPPLSILKVIENERRYSILKETSQLVEVERALRELDKAEIKNLPLKGYFMKQMYPQTDLRTMNDVDILVDKKDFKRIAAVFDSLGYVKKNIINSSEIHFSKDMLYFEIHSDLNSAGDEYYNDIWDRSVPRDGYKCSFAMSREDFYVYMVYHCAGHFRYGGLGIRMIMDIYVFISNYPDADYDYINSAFEQLGIKVFAERLRKTALNWFSGEETAIDNFGEFVLSCGTYGNRSIYFYQDNARTKGSYWLRQIFIPYKKMKKSYAYLSKAPFLLPLSWLQYWFTRIFINRDIQLKKGFTDRAENLDGKNAEFVGNLMKELDID